MKPQYDFSFGNTPGIRAALLNNCKGLNELKFAWDALDYPDHSGMSELKDLTRYLITKTTGISYEHILITGGATHSIAAYLYGIKEFHTENMIGVLTNRLYYRYYPYVIRNQGLYHRSSALEEPKRGEVHLIDSPSNPEGLIRGGCSEIGTIWDSVYHSPTYFGSRKIKIPTHEVNAGGYNKLTGLNGLRLGWFATKNKALYDLALEYLEGDVCGISSLSQWSAIHLVKNTNFDKFFKESNSLICTNKEELLKISHLFGNQTIPEIGMFALFEIDSKLAKLFNKSSVKFTDGRTMGDDRHSIRINLAKTFEETKAMVKEILKNDKRK